jgi:uncharacterized protein
LNKPLKLALASVVIAIGVTSAMDATGLSGFSALPLCLWFLLFWYLLRCSRREIGFTWGTPAAYALAVLYPLIVMSAMALLAWGAGDLELSGTDWGKAGRSLALMAVATVIVALLTEEAFFRGWLVAALERAGFGTGRVLLWCSVSFALWHWSWVTLPAAGENLPAWQIPVFLVNAAVIGAVWCMLRIESGSLLVASLSHGVWNALAYVLFGHGSKIGALGIKHTALFGPEVGILGLASNAAFALLLWQRWRGRAGR